MCLCAVQGIQRIFSTLVEVISYRRWLLVPGRTRRILCTTLDTLLPVRIYDFHVELAASGVMGVDVIG